MDNVAEFIAVRQRLESLVKQIAQMSPARPLADPAERLDQATQLLATLRTMVNNDVQEVAVGRLTKEVASAGKRIGSLLAKKRPAKKRPAV